MEETIEKIIRSARLIKKLRIAEPGSIHIVLDNCSIKHLYCQEIYTKVENRRYDIVITNGVLQEAQHGFSSFDPNIWQRVMDVNYFIQQIEPEIVHPSVDPKHEEVITQAWFDVKPDLEKRGMSCDYDIGVADMQMISHALQRAKQKDRSVIISEDNHVRWTMFNIIGGLYGKDHQLYRYMSAASYLKTLQKESRRSA